MDGVTILPTGAVVIIILTMPVTICHIHPFMLTRTVINTDKEDPRELMLTATTEVLPPMLHKIHQEGIKAPELTFQG